jgi:serine/threonine protein kinase/tetratricopeptide (TPR) repeat protein
VITGGLDPLLGPGAALEGPLWEAFCADVALQSPFREGDAVGPYRVLREIGRGGMSVVYLAERSGAFHQRVALKVLDRAPRDREARARFEQERQILARLEHPNIARLLDGGVDERSGLPFIVMELVEGLPIHRYCDEHRLTVDERLALFQVVTRAVAHAHRLLIVHRDLKPANVLVTAAGEVKLLDFGIAKLLDPGVAGPWAAPPTRTVQRLLTPEYAAPEQVRGEAVTTATDVYQLGLILYELLTGERAHGLDQTSLAEMERVVCSGEVPRPSALFAGRRRTPEQTRTAAARGAAPAALQRRLAGDLDSIVATALRKEPDRRYPSPAELAADLGRHRAGLPVTARGDSFCYRTGRLLRRHRLAVLAAAAVALSLLAGLGAALWQARTALREARKATEVQDFLIRIFEEATPEESQGRTVTARELLDNAAARIDALDGEPEVQAALLQAAGASYRNLGLYDAARPLLERSLRLRLQLRGERHLEVAESQHSLGVLRFRQGDTAGAQALHRAALATRRALLPPQDPRITDSLTGLAVALDDAPEAEPLLAEALALRLRGSGPAHPQVGVLLNQLGMLRHSRGRVDEAERLYREAVAVQRRALGEIHPLTASSLHNLAALLRKQSRLEESEALFRKVLRIEERLYDKDHPTLADTWGYLGHVLRDQGDLAGAEAAYRRSLEINRSRRGPDHRATLNALRNLGRLLTEAGRPREAEPLLGEALAGYRALYGPDHDKVRETEKLLTAPGGARTPGVEECRSCATSSASPSAP